MELMYRDVSGYCFKNLTFVGEGVVNDESRIEVVFDVSEARYSGNKGKGFFYMEKDRLFLNVKCTWLKDITSSMLK